MARSFSERSDSGDHEEEANNRVIRSIDLVAAARRQMGFLKRVSEAQWLHHPPTLLHAIRRYDELWMPLISDLTAGSTPPMVLPPLDVQWVWFCHTLNPGSYRLYCESRFSKLLEKPAIFDDLNEEYALNTCIEIWSSRYPSEPFELELITVDDDSTEIVAADESITSEVSKHKSLYSKFSDPYVSEIVYLIAAKLRYQRFLYLLHKTKDGYSKLVPTVDIQLMWITHQSYPVQYTEDMKEMERELGKVASVWDTVKEEDVEATKKLWDETFEQPLEKAGGSSIIELMMKKKPLFYWEDWNADVNSKYKSMEPRFLLEVCVFVRGNRETKEAKREFLRFKTVRCHREIKMDKPVNSVPCNTWRKMWHMYCEFSTRGVVLELRQRGGGSPICSKEKKSKVKCRVSFVWNELLRAQCLTLERELGQNWRLVASITPPTQAPYLLKCVPDRVTDDSGAMVSDLILKMNRYRPQEGRWLSRTVLDHGGRECFVLRIRVGSGFWRRGGEVPVAVKSEERIIEVREGSWRYVAGPIGRAPDKVVGTAAPKEVQSSENIGCWSLSTGYVLTVQWESSSGLGFNLQNETSDDSVRLLKGRKMQYQVNDMASKSKEEQEKEEDEFVTLIRYTPENPKGRATALMNWRLLVVELLPEEDAVLVLLLCMAILRSVSGIKREDIGGLLIRRRLKESAVGLRDWGSVLLHPSMSNSASSSSLFNSPHLQPWYWDAKTVMASVEADNYKTTALRYSPTEGDDKLYKRGIIP